MRPGQSEFRIAAAQVASVPGDIEGCVATHAAAIRAAARHGISVLVFPELSLTGYDPALAARLAIAETDSRLAPLGELAREHHLHALVGAPLRNPTGRPSIGIIVLPGDVPRTYRKMHLGGDEPEHFDPGDSPLVLEVGGHHVGLAVCADPSKPTHPLDYTERGADIYAVGVFLNAEWYESDAPRLGHYAGTFRLLTIMANHAQSVGRYPSVGRSAVWSPDGTLLAQADGAEPALVIASRKPSAWRGEVVPI